jgi:hypothetical protein
MIRKLQVFLRSETGDRRQETGDRRQETGDRRQETGDRRQETGDRRQETGDRRRETGDGRQKSIERPRRKPAAVGMDRPNDRMTEFKIQNLKFKQSIYRRSVDSNNYFETICQLIDNNFQG